MKTYKEFEAIKWYKGGKFTVDDEHEDEERVESDFKFITFDINIEHIHILEEVVDDKYILLFNKFLHNTSYLNYRLLTNEEIEKYVYSNRIAIYLLNPSKHYFYKDLPQEIKDRL